MLLDSQPAYYNIPWIDDALCLMHWYLTLFDEVNGCFRFVLRHRDDRRLHDIFTYSAPLEVNLHGLQG
jgi:hypothetical protein